jgi:SSS family solute:Na+ symporter
MGAARFVFELMDRAAGGRAFDNALLRGLVDMNFLHYSILMFVICCVVLIGVSLVTPAPERKQLAGLTFATVDDKMDVMPVRALDHKPAAETAAEHRLNVIFSLALIATVIGLWFHFR